MRVALFVPCYVDQFYPQAAIASLELLEKYGCEVSYPKNQTCCGQPMANSGFEHLSGGCNHKSRFNKPLIWISIKKIVNFLMIISQQSII
jgi:Fe-S oxidoreductase